MTCITDATLLAEGARELGIHLSEGQLQRFRSYFAELVDWNARVNLTSVTEWTDVQARHFLDSLSASLAIPPDVLKSGSLVDIGSGGGFPGVPLKIAFPGLRVTLVEATARKTAFLAHLVAALGLEGVDVRTGRAETLAHGPGLRESFDVSIARAVASMAVLAELLLPFCRVGGVAIAQKTLDIKDELQQAARAIEVMGGVLREVRPVSLDILGGNRALVVIEKTGPTPEKYPRRPGMPEKRPL